MFSLRFTLAFFLLLFIPFLLRFRYGDSLELYPAVTLPSEAYQIKKEDNHIAVSVTELFVKKKNVWQKVDVVTFLFPIPYDFFVPVVVYNDFGFKYEKGKNQNGKLFQFLKQHHFIVDRTIKEDQVKELKKWIKTKLLRQSFADSEIKVSTCQETISTATGEVLKKRKLH